MTELPEGSKEDFSKDTWWLLRSLYEQPKESRHLKTGK